MKVFLVEYFDGEGGVQFAGSTRNRAMNWIKKRQLENSNVLNVPSNDLFPYNIQEMEINREE